MGREVFVVVAIDDGKVKQCVVRTILDEADVIFKKWRETFGGANVALMSRLVDDNDTPWVP